MNRYERELVGRQPLATAKEPTVEKKTLQVLGGILVMLGAVVMAISLAVGAVPILPDQSPGRLWVAGAAALGLLSGFSAGVSRDPGSGKAFVTFLGAGILVPLLGGVGALFDRTQAVTEKSTYSGTQLVLKTTRTVTSPSDGSLHPLAVLGSFFLVFGILAILGQIGGALLRRSGAVEVMFA